MNREIKQEIRKAGLKQWQVAEVCGVSEFTFTRWLRHDLTDEKRQMILEAIKALEEGAK